MLQHLKNIILKVLKPLPCENKGFMNLTILFLLAKILFTDKSNIARGNAPGTKIVLYFTLSGNTISNRHYTDLILSA